MHSLHLQYKQCRDVLQQRCESCAESLALMHNVSCQYVINETRFLVQQLCLTKKILNASSRDVHSSLVLMHKTADFHASCIMLWHETSLHRIYRRCRQSAVAKRHIMSKPLPEKQAVPPWPSQIRTLPPLAGMAAAPFSAQPNRIPL